MPPVRRRIDPGSIAVWLVRTVAQDPHRPDDLLARLTGTTRAQITAACTAALHTAALVDRRDVSPASGGAAVDVTGLSLSRSEGRAA